MTIAFTICANNYMPHAKTLAESFKKYHPDIPFYIALVDEKHSDINYELMGADGIIYTTDFMRKELEKLAENYNIAELCTVVKPSLFRYIYENYDASSILYLDPDIEVISEFKEIFEQIKTNDLILTPHICSPTGDVGHPLDKDLMRTGIYNLGFLALKLNTETFGFIDWWDKRVREYGYHNLSAGHFYDQIWLGYAPAFLEKVYVLRHLGYNMANWNLHERRLIRNKGKLYVNDTSVPLRFYHFSNFNIENLPEIASYNENFSLDNRPDIVPLYTNYRARLLDNGYTQLNSIDYKYGKQPEPELKRGRVRLFARHILLGLKALIKGN